MRGRSLRSPKTQAAFLRLISKGVCCADAAAKLGIPRRTAYQWRQDDPEFRRAWDEAVQVTVEKIESKLYGKALRGDIVAMIFFLKAHRPEVYNRRMQVALGGDETAPPIAVANAGELGVQVWVPQELPLPEELGQLTIEGAAEPVEEADARPEPAAEGEAEPGAEGAEIVSWDRGRFGGGPR